MNKNSIITVRIDENTKKTFQQIVYLEGVDSSKVLTTFIENVNEEGKIPVEILEKIKITKNSLINIPLIKKVLNEVLLEWGKDNIEKVYLFGSYSRGEETKNSDVDLRIVANDKFGLFDLGYIASNLEEKLGIKVDIITGNDLDPDFYNEIKKDEICIYEY